jgi:hypothetical protein
MHTLDSARALHWGELARAAAAGDPIAAAQKALRDEGAAAVRGALAALGLRYTGTGGWHLVPCVTPIGLLGLVDTARGMAVCTDLTLRPLVIEALTVPAQGTGQVASGAAAWTAPDAGAPRRAAVPEGWVQLLVDVREDVADGVRPAQVHSQARVAVWGLPTCYGPRGRPGPVSLDRQREDRSAASWPWDPERTARVRALGLPWLDALILGLAARAGCHHAVARPLAQGRLHEAIVGMGAYRYEPGSYTASACLRGAARSLERSGPVREALREAHLVPVCDLLGDTWASQASGCRRWDLLEHLLARVVEQELGPVADALWAVHLALDVPETCDRPHDPAWRTSQAVGRQLPALVLAFVRRLLEPHVPQIRALEAQMVEAYLGGMPVDVDIPIPLSAPLES